MFGFYAIKHYEIRKLHMSPNKFAYVWRFTHSVYTKRENVYGFVKTKPQSIITTTLQ